MDIYPPFVFDLINFLRKNPVRAAEIKQKLNNLQELDRKLLHGGASRREVVTQQKDLIRLCGYNYGLLLPYVFPTFEDGKPLGFMGRPYMFAFSSMRPGTTLTVRSGRQVGKCADKDTEIITRQGGEQIKTTLGGLFDQALPAH